MQSASAAASSGSSSNGRPNILILMTDQERAGVMRPKGFTLPARDALAKAGVQFTMHHTPTAPCSPARSTLFTGLQAPVSGILDNVGNGTANGGGGQGNPSLSTDIPTIGTVLKRAGYRTCYIGKWHLSAPVSTDVDALTAYGFDEAIDILGGGAPKEGSTDDPGVAKHAQEWLAEHARDAEPWLCVFSLINPHDMMFCPRFYRLSDVPNYGAAPPSNFESDLSSKPAVQTVWRGENEVVGGTMPNEIGSTSARTQWRQWGNWYLELLRQTDALMVGVLQALHKTVRAQQTVIVQVADHGEVGGAHGLRQKGAMIYRENLRVPLTIVDPRRRGSRGAQTTALTSHVDLLPTLAALAGAPGVNGPGRSLTYLLDQPSDSVRGALLVTSDAPSSGLAIPTIKSGIRGVITPQYSYGRYTTLADVSKGGAAAEYECYDRLRDPGERKNLAHDPSAKELLRSLQQKVDQLVAHEL
jgi:arylsulfatase A-like enzyme